MRMFNRTLRLMGNRFDLTICETDHDRAEAHLDAAVAEIQRIEALLTTFRDDSQTALINDRAGEAPVKVDREVFDLIERGCKISALTNGAFDLTYGSFDKRFWNFDLQMTQLPDPNTAQAAVRLINWRNMALDHENCTVFLHEKGMRIGFGGIGKGYAADKARDILRLRGVTSGVVNASGDLCAWGLTPEGRGWSVGLSNPDQPEEALARFDLYNQSAATSGNYEKFVMIDGKRYSHTIDPKTGLPTTGLKSVTIIAPFAELADALTTPVMVMGPKAGLHLLNQIKGVEGVLMTDENEIFTTHNIRKTNTNYIIQPS